MDYIKSINKLDSKNYVSCCNILKEINNKKIKNPTKYKYFLTTLSYYDDIKNITKYCDREKINQKYNLLRFLLCFDYVEKNGNMLLNIYNVCDNKTLDIIYLGLFLFEKIVFYIPPFSGISSFFCIL